MTGAVAGGGVPGEEVVTGRVAGGGVPGGELVTGRVAGGGVPRAGAGDRACSRQASS